jgi:hypothetical protein
MAVSIAHRLAAARPLCGQIVYLGVRRLRPVAAVARPLLTHEECFEAGETARFYSPQKVRSSASQKKARGWSLPNTGAQKDLSVFSKDVVVADVAILILCSMFKAQHALRCTND